MSERLDLALQGHGGPERWHEIQSLDVRVSLTGGSCLIEGHPEGVPNVSIPNDRKTAMP